MDVVNAGQKHSSRNETTREMDIAIYSLYICRMFSELFLLASVWSDKWSLAIERTHWGD